MLFQICLSQGDRHAFSCRPVAATLPGLTEAFYAITVERRFANPLVADLLSGSETA